MTEQQVMDRWARLCALVDRGELTEATAHRAQTVGGVVCSLRWTTSPKIDKHTYEATTAKDVDDWLWSWKNIVAKKYRAARGEGRR